MIVTWQCIAKSCIKRNCRTFKCMKRSQSNKNQLDGISAYFVFFSRWRMTKQIVSIEYPGLVMWYVMNKLLMKGFFLLFISAKIQKFALDYFKIEKKMLEKYIAITTSSKPSEPKSKCHYASTEFFYLLRKTFTFVFHIPLLGIENTKTLAKPGKLKDYNRSTNGLLLQKW